MAIEVATVDAAVLWIVVGPAVLSMVVIGNACEVASSVVTWVVSKSTVVSAVGTDDVSSTTVVLEVVVSSWAVLKTYLQLFAL